MIQHRHPQLYSQYDDMTVVSSGNHTPSQLYMQVANQVLANPIPFFRANQIKVQILDFFKRLVK